LTVAYSILYVPKNTVPLTGRVPEPLKEQVKEMADEQGMSNSAMVRELVKDGIESREADHNDRGGSNKATESTLYAVALTAAVYLVAFPAAAQYLLLGAAAVFAIDGVVGYAKEAKRLLPGLVEFTPAEDPSDTDETATAAVSSPARIVGGGLMLLALGWIAVSGVF